MATDKPNRVGLVISTTSSIRDFLSRASKDSTLSEELRQTSSDLLLQSEVPYAPLRAVWMASDPSTRPDLTRLFSGTRLVFFSPKPREKVSSLSPLSVSISSNSIKLYLPHVSLAPKFVGRFNFLFTIVIGVKSEELKARLKKLEDLAERKAYQELVKDIAPSRDVPEPFSSYKDQLGFGKFCFSSVFYTNYAKL